MAQRPAVILLAFGDQHDPLAGRLLLMGFRALRAHGPAAVRPLLGRDAGPVRGMIIASSPEGMSLAELTSGLRTALEGGVSFEMVANGPRPGRGALDALRQLGVRHCLWTPHNDSELRFILNRVVYEGPGALRGDARVPTDMMVRVHSAAGEKPALVYNLSASGAFLETHRPTNVGGHIRMCLPLPTGPIETSAVVVAANVPGNLQRPNLPRGMGIRFEKLDASQRETIEKYIHERAGTYEL